MLPVFAVSQISDTTASTRWSGTTTSTLIFGTKPIVYSPPRYISVCPFWRPKPRTSDTVMPTIPASVSASLTSSSLNGLMMASTFFIAPSACGAVARLSGSSVCADVSTSGLGRLRDAPGTWWQRRDECPHPEVHSSSQKLVPLSLDQTAWSPCSPVRMRTASSSPETNTLPSPMVPVLAMLQIRDTTASYDPPGGPRELNDSAPHGCKGRAGRVSVLLEHS